MKTDSSSYSRATDEQREMILRIQALENRLAALEQRIDRIGRSFGTWSEEPPKLRPFHHE